MQELHQSCTGAHSVLHQHCKARFKLFSFVKLYVKPDWILKFIKRIKVGHQGHFILTVEGPSNWTHTNDTLVKYSDHQKVWNPSFPGGQGQGLIYTWCPVGYSPSPIPALSLLYVTESDRRIAFIIYPFLPCTDNRDQGKAGCSLSLGTVLHWLYTITSESRGLVLLVPLTPGLPTCFHSVLFRELTAAPVYFIVGV